MEKHYRRYAQPALLQFFLIALLVATFSSRAPADASSLAPIVDNLPPTIQVGFEYPSDFQVGLSSGVWDNSDGPWHLYLVYPESPFPPSPNVFEASSEIVHSGSQSAKLSLIDPITDRARRIHIQHDWNPIQDKHVWMEAWYYLPPDFRVDDWTDLHRGIVERLWKDDVYNWFQITATISRWSKVSNTEYKITTPINHGWVDNDGDGKNDLPQEYEVRSTNTIKLGQWFKITTYVYRDLQHGIYRFWLNDVLQWDLRDIRTVGILPERISEIGDNDGPVKAFIASGISLYSGTLPNVSPKYAYYDDFKAWLLDPSATVTSTSNQNSTTTSTTGSSSTVDQTPTTTSVITSTSSTLTPTTNQTFTSTSTSTSNSTINSSTYIQTTTTISSSTAIVQNTTSISTTTPIVNQTSTSTSTTGSSPTVIQTTITSTTASSTTSSTTVETSSSTSTSSTPTIVTSASQVQTVTVTQTLPQITVTVSQVSTVTVTVTSASSYGVTTTTASSTSTTAVVSSTTSTSITRTVTNPPCKGRLCTGGSLPDPIAALLSLLASFLVFRRRIVPPRQRAYSDQSLTLLHVPVEPVGWQEDPVKEES